MNVNEFKNLAGDLKLNHPLARYTSWRVGGPAQCFYRPAHLADLQNFIRQLPEQEALHWLGLGSNTLFRDGGFNGTVIFTLNRLNKINLIDPCIIRAEAGVTCAKLAKCCAREGFEAGAFFAGIPGTVGGALAMNAGAFTGETWEHVVAVEVINAEGNIEVKEPRDFDVNYRQVSARAKTYFAAGHFRFQMGNKDHAKLAIRELLNQRDHSQPIGILSCGSVFRNPPGDYAARLIETAGLKGVREGGASVSEKHANFIINDGHASAKEIENLIYYVKDQVWKHHEVMLTPEVHIIGEPELM